MPLLRTRTNAHAALCAFLPDTEARLVARYASLEHLPSGSPLAAVGSHERTLTLLLAGTATAERLDGTTSDLVGDPTSPAVIGELSLLRVRLSQVANVHTTSDVVVVRLPGRAFDRIAARCPALVALIEPALAERRESLAAGYAAERAARADTVRAYRAALERTARP